MSTQDEADSGQAGGPAARARTVLRMRQDLPGAADDMVIAEAPVALVYNGISHAVMMATPADLAEFALGFSLSEGIIARPAECFGIELASGSDGIAVQVEIAGAAFMALKERRRSLAGRTGCGLCGVDSLRQTGRLRSALPVLAPATASCSSPAGSATRWRRRRSWLGSRPWPA